VLRAAGHSQTIKPPPLQSAVPGGFTIHDFRIDLQAGMVRCPAGRQVPITSSGRASFTRSCPSCPLRRQCTTAKDGRTLHLHPTRMSCALPAAARPPAASNKAIGAGGRWWTAHGPGWSPTAAGGCPTAGPSATTCGGRCESPRSTCAGCWHLALLVSTRPGCWPDRAGTVPAPCAWHHRSPRLPGRLSDYCLNDQPVRIGKLQQAPRQGCGGGTGPTRRDRQQPPPPPAPAAAIRAAGT
jgi:hypothetical protein